METERSPHPFLLSFLLLALPSLFFAFRLVYIPASILSHTGHGLPYLNAVLVLCATFGLEYLARKSKKETPPHNRQQAIWFVVIALLLLGLFPEEAPTSAILWAAVGAVWGRLWPRVLIGAQIHAETTDMHSVTQRQSTVSASSMILFSEWWAGLLAGGLLGLTGLFGPGSWLVAALLALWGWRDVRED